MKALVIGYTSIRRLLRDRSNIFFVFLLPMMLILVLGAAFGGQIDPRLGVVAADAGELGQEMVAALESLEDVEVIDFSDADSLIVAVERGQLEAGLVIPAGYDTALRDSDEVTLDFVARPDQTAQAIRNAVDATVREQGALLRAAAFAESQGAAAFSDALVTAADIAADSPGLTVERTTVGEPFALETIGTFDMGAYTELLLFIFLTSMVGSAVLIQSRKLGVSTRMLSTPTSVRTIVIGEALGRFGVAMVQGLFIMLGSSLFFGVNWGNPFAAAVIMVVFSLGAAGTGMLMGSIFKNDQQAGGIGVMLGLGLAALGGCMVPLFVFEMFSPTLYKVAHITPHAWGVKAFEEITLYGGSVTDILPQLGVLSAFAVVVLSLATWRLRVALTR